MLGRRQLKARTQATFVLPADSPDGPVSTVWDCNHWTASHPLQVRGDGVRSATVVLAPHRGHFFRYLAAGDHWSDDDQADGHDGTNSRINT
ncbi:isoamylase early set domain-containing protein [Streptomyces xanthophaeus]